MALAEKLKKKKVAKPLVIPRRTYLVHSCSTYQIRNAQLSCVCGFISVVVEAFPSAVADSDLQMRGGGEGGHPEPSDKRWGRGGGAVSKKIFFGLKIREAVSAGPLPWLRRCSESFF